MRPLVWVRERAPALLSNNRRIQQRTHHGCTRFIGLAFRKLVAVYEMCKTPSSLCCGDVVERILLR